MSGLQTGLVFELALSARHQVVLLALADNAHDDGTRCYPGVPLLAWKTGYSERNVRRILRELEEARLIATVAHAGGGRGMATEFALHLENGVKKPPLHAGQPVRLSSRKADSQVSALPPEKPGQVVPKADKSDAKGGQPGVRPTSGTTEERFFESLSTASIEDNSDGAQLCERLVAGIRSWERRTAVPDAARRDVEPAGWLPTAERLLSQWPVAELERVIDYATSTQWWAERITGMPFVERNLKTLRLRAQSWRAPDHSDDGPLGTCPDGAEQLGGRWDVVRAGLRAVVDDGEFATFLEPLHPHSCSDEGWTVGAAAPQVSWVNDRFGRLLSTAAGKPVRLVACSGTHDDERTTDEQAA